MRKTQTTTVAMLMTGFFLATSSAIAAAPPPDSPAALKEAERLDNLPPITPHGTKTAVDHSGRAQKGRASYYAKHFNNRKMANGRRLDPNAPVAASKNLPLGTTAKVVNTQNGKEATVRVEDRGPYVDGRVVDVTPRIAKELDIGKQGVVPVVVKPIAVPQPDGGVKLGAGAADASPQEIRRATEVTKQLAGD
ncbi:MAG: hypothetical protein BGO51_24945 [Rhodospirillales bacterium 69-11]|nr:MAG: hypothetical protein BGO51_24945 [Rhodospirillales bacterium 69-11]